MVQSMVSCCPQIPPLAVFAYLTSNTLGKMMTWVAVGAVEQCDHPNPGVAATNVDGAGQSRSKVRTAQIHQQSQSSVSSSVPPH